MIEGYQMTYNERKPVTKGIMFMYYIFNFARFIFD